MSVDVFSLFASGILTCQGKDDNVSLLPWTAHPVFPGVWLKDVVTSDRSGGAFTAHLVRIEPGCAIGEHVHEGSMELHEVLSGEGICLTPEGTVPYSPGRCALIPRGAIHEVRAGESGLGILAKFFRVPA